MLTSHHYLLGGLVAVSCATGILSHGIVAPRNWSPVSSESAPIESVESETLDISYRGSGRVNGTPKKEMKNSRDRDQIAHRGSGRVLPQQAL